MVGISSILLKAGRACQLTISCSSPGSTYSASLPRDRTVQVRTDRLSGSAIVLLSSCNRAGIWFVGLAPAPVGAIAIESRSMKVVWRATSRWETVPEEAMLQSQGSSSGQTPFSSSRRAMVETTRAEAVRAWELKRVKARISRVQARPDGAKTSVLGLGEEEVEQAGLQGSPDLLRLGKPLLVLLGRDALPELDERELPDLSEPKTSAQSFTRESSLGQAWEWSRAEEVGDFARSRRVREVVRTRRGDAETG